MRTWAMGVFLVVFSSPVLAQPRANECPQGSQQTSHGCAPVVIPANAELDVLGHGWTCQSGYVDTTGKCLAVVIPRNAELDVLGHGWTCQRGFRDVGHKCVAVVVPEHAELDIFGHGWKCNSGYHGAGGSCVTFVVPENAELDLSGNGWVCKLGFALTSGHCVALPPEQRRKLEQAVARRTARLREVASAQCEIDGKPADGDHGEVVFQRMGCDYFIVDGPHGLYVLEWYGGHSPSVGDIIVGPIGSYGFTDVCYLNDGEGRVYVDDYDLGESSALEKYKDKCN